MSSNYTGDPTAAQAPSPPPGRDIEPVVTLPTDGDAGNAASVMQAFKVLADFGAWLTNHSAIKDDGGNNDMTTIFRWLEGASQQIDGVARLVFGAPTDDRQCIAAFKQDAGGDMYSYLWQENKAVGGGFTFSPNAWWNQTGSVWERQTAGVSPAMILRVRGSEIRIGYVDGSAASWADSAWTGYAGLVSYAPLAGAPANGLQSEGPVLVARGEAGAAIPTSELSAGEILRESIPIGRYRCDWTGGVANIKRVLNVKSHTRTAQGFYDIIFWPVVASPANAHVDCKLYGHIVSRDINYTVADAGGADAGRIKVSIAIDALTAPGGGGALTGAPLDDEFSVTLWY